MVTALVILNYNNWEDTINCIESVEKYNTAPIKYVIVDNGSTREKCISSLDSWLHGKFSNDYQCAVVGMESPLSLPKVTMLVSDSNEGYARGNNLGINYLRNDKEIENIMILNNDVLFVEDIVQKLVDALSTLPQCAIVSPILYKRDQVELDYNCARIHKEVWSVLCGNLYEKKESMKKYQLLHLKPELQKEPYFAIDLPSGACMLMSKEVMNTLGGFDPHTFLYYEEDILFCKINALGLKNYIITRAKCIHLGASSTKKRSGAFLVKTAFDSQKYFLENYCNLSFAQSIVLRSIAYYVRLKCYIFNLKSR